MRQRVVVALSVAVLALLAGPGGQGSLRAQSPAQPELTVTMYSSVVEYRTVPTTVVLAELADAQGPKASGEGISDASGLALVQFLPLPGARDRYVRPGDRISLARIGARPLIVDVPNLTGDVDVAGGRIVGTAPAGAQVRVVASTGTGATLERIVTADPTGAWQVAGQLATGQASGSASYDDPEGRRFVARFADLSVTVTLGARTLRGRGTPGTLVTFQDVRADGTQYQVATEIVEDAAWSTRLPVGGVVPGDSLRVVEAGGPAPQTAPVEVPGIPEIAVAIDAARDRVVGHGPAGASVVVEAWALSGQVVERVVTASGEPGDPGAFAVDLAGEADLGPGWRVRAGWQADPQLRLDRLAVVSQALIGAHTSAVRGIAPPGAPVTVTLRAANGDLKASTPTRGDDDGAFDARLGGLMPGAAVTVEAGDVVEVAFVAGDPLVAQVPYLVARADPAGDRVLGVTAPGAAVQVKVLSDPGAPTVEVVADAQGLFSAWLGDGYDLRRPANGTATVMGSSGAVFYTSWAAVQLSVQIGASTITGYGPPGRAYTARLLDADGSALAVATGTAYDFPDLADIVMLTGLQGFMVASFQDATGAPVEIRSGDRLEVQAGDDEVSLEVPPLEGVVFVEDDVLVGRTTPYTAVSITVESLTGQAAAAQAVSDGTGQFTHDFGGTHDVQYNDSVALAVTPDGHAASAFVPVPGLVLDMDEWSLSGTVAPNEALVVSARRDARLVVEARASSGADGSFRVWLCAQAEAQCPLAVGDRIEVREAAAGGESVSMLVPELAIEADSATDTIRGRVTPGGALVLLVLRQVLDVTGFGIGQAWPTIEADGSWQARPIPTHDVRPGTTIIGQYRLPGGHMAIGSHIVPLLAVDHGTPNLCGHSAARAEVGARLGDRDGSELATARGWADGLGKYEMVLRDAEAGPVRTAVSQTVAADLAGTAADVTLPRFELVADWAGHSMSGVGPPNTLMLGLFPAMRCPSLLTDISEQVSVVYAVTDEQGRFTGVLPPVAPGQGVELAFQTADGHVVFRQAYRALGRVFVDTDRVGGITDSLADVRLTLRAGDGSEVVAVATAAGPLGGFEARLSLADGSPAIIEAGSTVVLEAAGDRAEIEVAPLSFDWSPGGAVAGQAPSGRVVVVHLRLADGRVAAIERTTDAAGTFGFGVDDVPARAPWTMGDVVGVRVVLPTAAGHEIVSQTARFEAPTAHTPPRVYLPVVVRGSAPGARSAVADGVGQATGTAHVGRPEPLVPGRAWQLARFEGRVAAVVGQLVRGRDGSER